MGATVLTYAIKKNPLDTARKMYVQLAVPPYTNQSQRATTRSRAWPQQKSCNAAKISAFWPLFFPGRRVMLGGAVGRCFRTAGMWLRSCSSQCLCTAALPHCSPMLRQFGSCISFIGDDSGSLAAALLQPSNPMGVLYVYRLPSNPMGVLYVYRLPSNPHPINPVQHGRYSCTSLK